MDIESKIRSRIEAILINDARNDAEIQRMATADEPLILDPMAEERNLYQRIINNYRCAVSEVNNLLEQNIGLLSGLLRAADSIKASTDLQEIGVRVIECLLRDFGAEYAALFFPGDGDNTGNEPVSIEGMREERAVFSISRTPGILNAEAIDRLVELMKAGPAECLNLGDVYREPQLVSVDFPSVVRSLIGLPLKTAECDSSLLILSHSLPNYFSDNHVRVLRILRSILAHLKVLLNTRAPESDAGRNGAVIAEPRHEEDTLSVVLLDFEGTDMFGRIAPMNMENVRSVRKRLQRILEPKESISFYDGRILMALFPGVSSAALPPRVTSIRDAFHEWIKEQGERMHTIRMNVGFSTCKGNEDLSRTIEVAANLWHRD